MTIPVIKIKVFPKSVIKAKMDVRFPASVDVTSPILLDRTGGNFAFSLDVNSLVLSVNASNPDLAAIEALTGTGLIARTADGVAAVRTLQAPAAGLTIANPAGTAGNPTFALANDLSALEGLSSTGVAVRSAADTWVQRTITGTANQITVTNGNGVSGDPTISIPSGFFANPTASIGLTANNGSAATSMRSDGAPALSQAIAPTWTGVHEFTNLVKGTLSGPVWASQTGHYDGWRVAINGFPLNHEIGNGAQVNVHGIVGAISVPSNAVSGGAAFGVAGYAETDSSNMGAVGLYGQGTILSGGPDAAHPRFFFGINTVCTNAAQMATSGNGFDNFEGYGWEMDVNLRKVSGAPPAGRYRGIVFIGGCEAQPTGDFDAISIESPGVFNSPKTKWKRGVHTANGAATVALDVGADSESASANSQTVVLNGTTSGGANIATTVFSDSSGNLQIFPGGSGVLSVNSSVTITGAVRSSSATLQVTPSNPTGTSSTTPVMMGLGGTCKLTPVNGTRIKVEFHIGVANGAVANASTLQVRYGTGTAPTNGAAGTGTTVGAALVVSSPGASFQANACVGGIITGLTPGTQYWFDVSLAAQANTSTIQGVDCNAMEF